MILRQENNILNTNGGKTFPQTSALVIGLTFMPRPAFLSKTLFPPTSPLLPPPRLRPQVPQYK